MIDQLMWVVTIASIIGTVANVYKKSWCFIVWASTNFMWVVYNIHKEIYAQAALWVVYFGLSVWGWCKWKKSDTE